MNIFKIPSKLYYLYTSYYNYIEILRRENYRRLQFENFMELQMEAFPVHQKVFPQYKNFFKSRDVAVIGSGPSLDRWNPKDDCVQIGVNGTFMSNNVNLDYLFIQDYDIRLFQRLNENRVGKCKYFFGTHYLTNIVTPIPLFEIERFSANQYFFYNDPKHIFPFDFTIDISSKPFITYGSVIFVALQFALYTHPKRLYIVGCDCSSGHFELHNHTIHNNDVSGLNQILDGWKKFANFAKALYPDIEIVCVNPVGLKGLFVDEYTE